MKPFEFPLLCDENLHPKVVEALRARGADVETVAGAGLGGAGDAAILAHAHAIGRVVVTHDADFGTLAVLGGADYVGIIHLRPGHIEPRFVLETVDAVEALVGTVHPPFIVVGERRARSIRVRLRGGRDTAAE